MGTVALLGIPLLACELGSGALGRESPSAIRCRGEKMTKREHCNCKSGCQNNRCTCFKNNEPCDENCGCTNCQNPLNGVDVENLSICAVQNIQAYKALSAKDLAVAYELPCGHESVPLEKLLKKYECQECGEVYWYSFCWNRVVQDSCTWHCEVCRQCQDWRVWHCEICNKCTYGISLPCEHCGNDEGLEEFRRWFP